MQIRHLSAALCRVRISSISSKVVKAAAILFWLLVWHIAAVVIGERILLVSPVTVVARLLELLRDAEVWHAAAFSTLRICCGFLLSLVLAVILAAAASCIRWVRIALEPLVQAFKVVPVASIVIVVLIWVSSRNLSVIISFMMVFPVLYTNLLSAIDSTDRDMLEMSRVFRLSRYRKFRLVYLPQVYPYFLSSSSLSLGLAWKSGVAAEVIGIPSGSMGDLLYEAKVFFATADVFAYTLLIVMLSVGFEFVMKSLIRAVGRRLEAV